MRRDGIRCDGVGWDGVACDAGWSWAELVEVGLGGRGGARAGVGLVGLGWGWVAWVGLA